MNPYLAKLRAWDQETSHPQEPSKPSKPAVPVVTHGDTTAEKGFEGFEGHQNRCFSRNVRKSSTCSEVAFVAPSSISNPAART